jgi:nucleotide-binding universal stress UspA family protein
MGAEDLADVESCGLTYGGLAVDASSAPAQRPRPSADPSVTVDPDRPSVLCAVGDDELAETTVATAGDLAERMGLRLTLVHSPDTDLFLIGEANRAALDRGHALLDRVAERWPMAQRVVQTGEPAALVSAAATSDKTAFIVVGSRGRGAFTSALLGSVSNEIVRGALCPVVIVPASADTADAARQPEAVPAEISGRSRASSPV